MQRGNGVIVLDIGGGTADIAVVKEDSEQKPVVKFKQSLNFGARKVLSGAFLSGNVSSLSKELLTLAFELYRESSQSIKENYADLFDSAGIDSGMSLDEIKSRLESGNIKDIGLLYVSAAELENILYRERDVQAGSAKVFNFEVALNAFSSALELVGSRNGIFHPTLGQELAKRMCIEPAIKKPFLKINLALASLFFYLGSCLKCLQEKHKNEFDYVEQVILAGNGSRITEWLFLSSEEKDTGYLGYFFKQGLGNNKAAFSLLKSSNRKHEVAMGLLEDGATPDGDSGDELETFYGLEAHEYLYNFLLAFCRKTEKQSDIDLLLGNDIFKKEPCGKFKEEEKVRNYINRQLRFADNSTARLKLREDCRHAPWLFALDLISRID